MMPELNYLAIAVSAVVMFIASSIYYIGLGRQLAALNPIYADSGSPAPLTIALEFGRNVVVAGVAAILVGLIDMTDLGSALLLAAGLWIGFPVIVLAGAVIHENVPSRLAAIHAGDWLIKLLIVTAIVSIWR